VFLGEGASNDSRVVDDANFQRFGCLWAGLRHVRGVRPNRAADFRGPPFWTLKKFRINCVGI